MATGAFRQRFSVGELQPDSAEAATRACLAEASSQIDSHECAKLGKADYEEAPPVDRLQASRGPTGTSTL